MAERNKTEHKIRTVVGMRVCRIDTLGTQGGCSRNEALGCRDFLGFRETLCPKPRNETARKRQEAQCAYLV